MSDLDLHLDLDPTLGRRAGLEQALRQAIRSGALSPGTKLPSSRRLAPDLGVARNTVAAVYTQLVAEGYLAGTRGAGTRVAGQLASGVDPDGADTGAHGAPALGAGRDPLRTESDPTPRHDLRPGRPDLSQFPASAWVTATRNVLNTCPAEALAYADACGPRRTRGVLANYLGRVRGVHAAAEHVLPCTGFRQAIALTLATLHRRGARRIGVERPGLPELVDAVRTAGMTPVPVPVDSGGAQVHELPGMRVDAVVLTPAHQFPTGAPLEAERRAAVLDWARRARTFVVEDDYDSEFRYDRRPMGALQGLAPDRVLYVGSASKTLAPGLRLAWAVAPSELIDDLTESKRQADRHSPTLDQLVLAELIETGTYDRHLRAARRRYQQRRSQLVHSLARLPTPLETAGIAAGLHVVVPLPASWDEDATTRHLLRQGVVVSPMSRYTWGLSPRPALVIGYGAPAQHAWPSALAALVDALSTNPFGCSRR